MSEMAWIDQPGIQQLFQGDLTVWKGKDRTAWSPVVVPWRRRCLERRGQTSLESSSCSRGTQLSGMAWKDQSGVQQLFRGDLTVWNGLDRPAWVPVVVPGRRSCLERQGQTSLEAKQLVSQLWEPQRLRLVWLATTMLSFPCGGRDLTRLSHLFSHVKHVSVPPWHSPRVIQVTRNSLPLQGLRVRYL